MDTIFSILGQADSGVPAEQETPEGFDLFNVGIMCMESGVDQQCLKQGLQGYRVGAFENIH